MVAVAACATQRFSSGQGLWLPAWQCEKNPAAGAIHFESIHHQPIYSQQTGNQMPGLPGTDAGCQDYEARLAIRMIDQIPDNPPLTQTGELI